MNESVLADTFFEENEDQDMLALTLWEAHKCVVRRHLIKMCTQRKKEQRQRMEELTRQFSDLEAAHKSTQSDEDYMTLLEARKTLRDILHQKLQHTIQKSHRFFFEYSNKCGRLLARMLQKKRHMCHISKLKTKEQTITQFLDKITELFQEYYHTLYNLSTETSSDSIHRRERRITEYLQKHGTKTLSQDTAEELEAPISMEELQVALKGSKLNKAPRRAAHQIHKEIRRGYCSNHHYPD
ncbi:Hypothetical predicted protein [Pelobates cultripes]|uniref:Uncharacterized protein n=1 Tax=Pelobates cultripes TaxID=61616 RepID=A0AAD1SZV9_PELCU|nr:Hypothetical predicted protein [Pelobates cultripes]